MAAPSTADARTGDATTPDRATTPEVAAPANTANRERELGLDRRETG